MWLKSNLFVIFVILLVINLFDESYAKGGMAKNSGKRKFFFLVKDGPSIGLPFFCPLLVCQ